MAQSKDITLDQAKKLVKDFRDKNPKAIKAELFDADHIRTLLNGAAGLRIYYGSDNGKAKLVLVGVDGNGKDLLPPAGADLATASAKIVADGQPCPDVCDTTSGLNN